MRIPHAADLYIDSSLSRLRGRPDGEAAGFTTETRGAFPTLIGHALANESSFIVLAVNVFDGGWADYADGLSSLSCLADLAQKVRAPITAGQRLGEPWGLV